MNEHDVKYNKVEWIGIIILVLVIMGGCNTCSYINYLDNDSSRKYELEKVENEGENEGTDIHSEPVQP